MTLTDPVDLFDFWTCSDKILQASISSENWFEYVWILKFQLVLVRGWFAQQCNIFQQQGQRLQKISCLSLLNSTSGADQEAASRNRGWCAEAMYLGRWVWPKMIGGRNWMIGWLNKENEQVYHSLSKFSPLIHRFKRCLATALHHVASIVWMLPCPVWPTSLIWRLGASRSPHL